MLTGENSRDMQRVSEKHIANSWCLACPRLFCVERNRLRLKILTSKILLAGQFPTIFPAKRRELDGRVYVCTDGCLQNDLFLDPGRYLRIYCLYNHRATKKQYSQIMLNDWNSLLGQQVIVIRCKNVDRNSRSSTATTWTWSTVYKALCRFRTAFSDYLLIVIVARLIVEKLRDFINSGFFCL